MQQRPRENFKKKGESAVKPWPERAAELEKENQESVCLQTQRAKWRKSLTQLCKYVNLVGYFRYVIGCVTSFETVSSFICPVLRRVEYIDCQMMMIAFITFNGSLVPLIEGLCSSNPWEFEFSGFRRNRTDDIGINSPLLWPTRPPLHMRSWSLSWRLMTTTM